MSSDSNMTAAEVIDFSSWAPHVFSNDGRPFCDWCDEHIDQAPEGSVCLDNLYPTPNDMLAWLKESGYTVGEWDIHGGGIEVIVYHIDTADHHSVFAGDFQTALENIIVSLGRNNDESTDT